MPVCPNCSSQQPDGVAFCDSCGAALGGVAPAVMPPAAVQMQPIPTAVVATCPICGAPATPGEAFCNSCGATLEPTVPVSPPQVAAPAPLPPAVTPAPAPAGVPVCPSCGAQLEPGSNFCDMCGAPVGAVALPASVPAPAPVSPAPIPPVAPTPVPGYPAVAGVQGRLVVQGTNATLPFPPAKTEIFIGREDPVSGVFPEIDLTDHGGDEGGVSRRHARIFSQGAQVLIEDLNSTNYTYVNQQKLTPGQPQPLNSGDEVRVGQMKLNFYA